MANRRSKKYGYHQMVNLNPYGYFVYLLWGDDEDCPIYVGQSTNVMSRIASHMKDKVKGPRIRYVTLERCKSKEQMDFLERELIRQYLPELNIVRYQDAA